MCRECEKLRRELEKVQEALAETERMWRVERDRRERAETFNGISVDEVPF